MITAIEKPKESSFKRTRQKNGVSVNEAPKLFHAVNVDNYRQRKVEMENKTKQEFEVGLPPQPKEYLKYPDYDWF